MSALDRVIWLVKLPIRLVWKAFRVVIFLIFAPLYLLVGAFVAYWLALTFSYIFLPEAWTEAMWTWASGLYAEHLWFKIATIAAFTLLIMPIITIWPGRDPLEEALNAKKITRLNNEMIAARNAERV